MMLIVVLPVVFIVVALRANSKAYRKDWHR
jgi:hypothetical protein